MIFDLPTLMTAAAFVAAVSGAFLVFAWLQDRNARGTLWWAAADLLLAATVPLSFHAGKSIVSPVAVVAITFLNISPALIWAAARDANGRAVSPFIVCGGAALWLLALADEGFRHSTAAQAALNLAIIVAYLYAAAFEFWRERYEGLGARWPLIVLLLAHGGVFIAGSVRAAAGQLPTVGPAPLASWMGLIHFETMVFVLGTAIFTVAMTRERIALVHKQAALVDHLTGIANRRAFTENAASLIERCRIAGMPLSVAVFDLDRFKSINDNYGHKTGDQVLVAFTETARRVLRPTDLLGRLGGEEFAVMMPGADGRSACAAAERIRVAFTQACEALPVKVPRATTSAGVSTGRSDTTLDSLMAAADSALYRAKATGRDMVEVEEPRPDAGASDEMPAGARIA